MQKYAILVEIEKCCQTHIFLQNFVLIQPSTSPPKICKILQKIVRFANNYFANFANSNPLTLTDLPAERRRANLGGDPLAEPAAAAGRGRLGAAPRDAANFTGLVLGCIEAKFCK